MVHEELQAIPFHVIPSAQAMVISIAEADETDVPNVGPLRLDARAETVCVPGQKDAVALYVPLLQSALADKAVVPV